MMKISLGLNSAILTPLTLRIYLNPAKKEIAQVLGPDTQARRILLAMYSAINVFSMVGSSIAYDNPNKAALLAAPIFGVQIFYKTHTAFYNKGWTPVIYWNQFVTVIHLYTLFCMHQDGLLDAFLK